MASGSRFPRRIVNYCNDHDVIFGRGKGSYNNPGNKHLQHVIRQQLQQYDVADLQNKTIIAHKVVDVMTNKNPPSRFLKPDKDVNRWYEMSREEVVKKVKQDFANLKSAHKRKIEDEVPMQDRKRQAMIKDDDEVAAPTSLLEEYGTIDGTKEEVKREVSAIIAVINQVFVHNNPRLDHQKQAEMILNDDTVKEAVVSILEWKAEKHHAAMLKERISISSPARPPHSRIIQQAKSSSPTPVSDSSHMPLNTPKADATQMQAVCDKVHFEAKMDDVNNITPKLRVKGDRTYTGSVMNNSPHGIGFMKFDDGRIYCGAWRKGKLHGNACVLYKNGDSYLGEFSKNKRVGEGVCYYNDGSIYQGRFENDRLNGKGAYRSRDGHVYEGDFVNGDFEGVGVHRRQDGTEQSGRFINWKLAPSEKAMETGDGDEKEPRSKDKKEPVSKDKDEANKGEKEPKNNSKKGLVSEDEDKPNDGKKGALNMDEKEPKKGESDPVSKNKEHPNKDVLLY